MRALIASRSPQSVPALAACPEPVEGPFLQKLAPRVRMDISNIVLIFIVEQSDTDRA